MIHKISLSSNLLFVEQPDTYENPIVEGIIDTKSYEYNHDNPDYIIANNPAWKHAIKVPNDNKVYGYFTYDFDKTVEALTTDWVDTLEAYIAPIGRVKYTGYDSPKEYNFVTDCTIFDLYISDYALDKLYTYCIKDDDAFSKFLKDHYSSYDGFISFLNNDYNQWKEDWDNKEESALWQALAYYIDQWHDEFDMDYDDCCINDDRLYDAVYFEKDEHDKQLYKQFITEDMPYPDDASIDSDLPQYPLTEDMRAS
jgi:hypothetical protein